MSRGRFIADQSGLHFLTLQIVEWIDIFTRECYREIIIDSLNYCRDKKGLQLFAYVIMSNHIHLLASCPDGNLSNVIRDFKKYSSVQIISSVKLNKESRRTWMLRLFSDNAMKTKRNIKYQVWTHSNYPLEIHSAKFIRQKLNYIHNNPVKAGIVAKPEDYLYSSARNYNGMKSKIEVTLLSVP